MFLKLASVIILSALLIKTAELKLLSWCDPVLCPRGVQHIACNNSGVSSFVATQQLVASYLGYPSNNCNAQPKPWRFSCGQAKSFRFHESCQPDTKIVNLNAYRNFILHEHNKRRNFIASGNLPGYYPAAKMAALQWDDELAYLAELNIKTCVVEHEDCKNSYRFRNVGQNLFGIDRPNNLPANIPDVIQTGMALWFGEYSLIDSNYIANFKVDKNFEMYGHFAEFVLDRNTHVGCAMLRYTHPVYKFLHIYNTACNYASIYALDVPVYRVGKPASLCITGKHPKYSALCSPNEPFNPNYSLEL